jgi:uncharacterized protein YdcH (DUF465 family)
VSAEADKSHVKFAAVVEKVAGVESGAAVPMAATTTDSLAERRRILLEYREKVAQTRKVAEERLAKLVEAHTKIDAELAQLDQREQEQVQAEIVEARRKQVEEIKKQFVAPAPAVPAGGPAKARARTQAPPVGRAPRFDIHAVVRFGKSPDHVVMRARNISMTGALLASEPGMISLFPVGSEHAAKVFLSAEPKNGIELRGKIVRHEQNAIVVDWSDDAEATFRVALLISALAPEETT